MAYIISEDNFSGKWNQFISQSVADTANQSASQLASQPVIQPASQLGCQPVCLSYIYILYGLYRFRRYIFRKMDSTYITDCGYNGSLPVSLCP